MRDKETEQRDIYLGLGRIEVFFGGRFDSNLKKWVNF